MRTKRLYARIYWHILGVLLVVGIATSAVFSIGQHGFFLREVAARLSRHVASELGERFSDPEVRRVTLDRLHQDFELDLTLRDLGGALLARAGAAGPALDAAELAAVRRGEAIFQKQQAVAAAPLREPKTGAVVGVLQLAMPHRFRTVGLASFARPLLAVALVLVLVAMASFPLARRISRPVELLTIASRRLGAGELSYRIPLPDWCPYPQMGQQRPWQRPNHGPHPRYRHWRHRHHAHFLHRHHEHPPDEMQELLYAWNDMADRIERLMRGQRELLANISHELRSPLTRVRVALALLPREGESEARIDEVEADLTELERLIEDVLMTSRLEATGLPAHPTPVSLRPLLGQVAERARNDPSSAGKTIQVAEGGELTLRADPTLLKRALFNLVENAAKYGGSPIVLAAERQGDSVEISVTDEGEGIPQSERERVFDPFYRADKARSPQAREGAPRGFGLGLTLARRVAEAHGGTIAITDAHPVGADAPKTASRGCRITLRLPINLDDSARN